MLQQKFCEDILNPFSSTNNKNTILHIECSYAEVCCCYLKGLNLYKQMENYLFSTSF